MAEPAWFTHKVDQLLAKINHLAPALPPGMDALMAMLEEPREDATPEEHERWQRSCSNCGAYCPDPVPYYVGHIMRKHKTGTPVAIIFGTCLSCRFDPE